MIQNLDSWIYGKLNTGILAGNVHYFYPNSFNKLPIIAFYTAQSMSDMDYQDDVNKYIDSTVYIDIYVKNDTDDFSLTQTIDTIMTGLVYNLNVIMPIPDPDAKTQHKHMEYTRQGISPGDII